MEAPPQPAGLARVPTGIAGFDQLLHGGFLRGGVYLIAGPPGAGKTIIGNQICFHHVAAGGWALFVTLLTESHSRMLAHLATLHFFDHAPIGKTLHYFSGYGTLADEGLGGLLTFLRSIMRDHKATLLVLDGLLNVEASASSPLALRRFLHDLQAYAEVSNCTVLLLAHIDSELQLRSEHAAVDGVIALSSHRVGIRALREIEVWKLRGSGFVEGRHAQSTRMASRCTRALKRCSTASRSVCRARRGANPSVLCSWTQCCAAGCCGARPPRLWGRRAAAKRCSGCTFSRRALGPTSAGCTSGCTSRHQI